MKQFRVERPKLRQVEKLRENKFKTAKIYLDLSIGICIGICIHYVALLLKISIHLSIYLSIYLSISVSISEIDKGEKDERNNSVSKIGIVNTRIRCRRCVAPLSIREGRQINFYLIILHNRHYNESSLNIRIKKECGVNFHKEAKERISLLMLCAPSNRWRPFSDRKENVGLRVFSCFVRFLVKEFGINSKKCIEYGK